MLILFPRVTSLHGPSQDLRGVSASITRSKVQKSVFVVSEVPFFGWIYARTSVVTRAFFASLGDAQAAGDLFAQVCLC